MKHISNNIPAGQYAGRSPLELLRERLPKLADVPDDEILKHGGDLWDVADCARKCKGCTDFTTCWRDGEARGWRKKAQLQNGLLHIETLMCEPRKAHDARQAQQTLLSRSGMTEELRRFTFDNYPDQQRDSHRKIYDWAWNFAESHERGQQGQGLYIFGPNGIAKTHLVLAVINRLNDQGVAAVFVRTDDLIDQLRSAIARGKSMEEEMARFRNAPVLGMDEFAQERKTDFHLEQVQRLIEYRSTNRLPTFFTSNFLPTEVYEDHFYGADERRINAIRSRLAMMSIPARMTGEDHRLKNLYNALGPEEDADV